MTDYYSQFLDHIFHPLRNVILIPLTDVGVRLATMDVVISPVIKNESEIGKNLMLSKADPRPTSVAICFAFRIDPWSLSPASLRAHRCLICPEVNAEINVARTVIPVMYRKCILSERLPGRLM